MEKGKTKLKSMILGLYNQKKKEIKPFTKKLILDRSILSDINYGTTNVIY